MNWRPTTATEIAHCLDARLVGSDIVINRPAPIWDADINSVSFLTDVPAKSDSNTPIKAGLIVTKPEHIEVVRGLGISAIEHTHPKFAFCKAAALLMQQPSVAGIHPSAVIGDNVKIGNNAHIGPFCFLDGDIEIGDNTIVESHVTLSNKVTIGANSIIHSGCRIGYDPFSYGRSTGVESYRFPSQGGVSIGDFVNIFHNVNIARGVAADTVLADWVRVGNAAHIGNTVSIGSGTMICAQTDISARTTIGERCWIAQSAAIRQSIDVGDGATIGMGAVVVANVDKNTTVVGVPARIRDLPTL